MTGEQRIAAPRQRVWEALNDATTLKQCIPGCEMLERESEERLKATVAIKVGPIGARFSGAVTLSDVDPANSYTIKLEGQGGTAGFAKGSANVRLIDDGDGTLLSYEADVQVGGRLAQLGGAIIDATAKQLAGNFFTKLGKLAAVQSAPPGEAARPDPAPASPPPSSAAPRTPSPSEAAGAVAAVSGKLPIAWVLAVVVGVLTGFLLGRAQGGDVASVWLGLSIGLMVVIVAAAAFEFGRRAATPVIVVDPATLARLTSAPKENGR